MKAPAKAVMNLRGDHAFIARWISPGSHVLDLGCADGTLLAYLQSQRQCTGYGVEISDANVAHCVRRGVGVIQLDLDAGLSLFQDGSFDVAMQLETLQAMRQVEDILREIARVGREAIVSFPNFGYWQNRLQILAGRMPVSERLPYEWYDTPNIRCATIKDFEQLAEKLDLEILDRVALHRGRPVRWLSNLRGSLAVFKVRKRPGSPV